ncbi:MAG TPA: DUF3149 domain-containing protein [Candidatus Competibacteraceae bacterium]|nr:DUF3149 domain-containing protein [Candidatus Competibacteraceae bacterium]
MGSVMKQFLTTDYGLISLAGLLFIFGMMGYLIWLFWRKAHTPPPEA